VVLAAAVTAAVLALPAPPASAEETKYLGGVTIGASRWVTEANCDILQPAVSAPCIHTLNVNYRIKAQVPASSSAPLRVWVEVQGHAADDRDTVYFVAAGNVANVAGAVPNVPAYYNSSGDLVAGCAVAESAACKAFPNRGETTFTSTVNAGVRNFAPSGQGSSGSPGRFNASAWPKVRVVLWFAGDGAYEASEWIEPVVTEGSAPPDPGTPGFGGSHSISDPEAESSGDAEADAACGAWWHLPCHLRRLFEPQQLGAQWDAFYGEVESSYPLGPVLYGVGAIADALTSFANGATELGGPPECSWGPDFPVGEQAVRIEVGEVLCQDSSLPLGDFKPITLTLSRLGIILAVILLAKRLFERAIGGGSGGGGEEA